MHIKENLEKQVSYLFLKNELILSVSWEIRQICVIYQAEMFNVRICCFHASCIIITQNIFGVLGCWSDKLSNLKTSPCTHFICCWWHRTVSPVQMPFCMYLLSVLHCGEAIMADWCYWPGGKWCNQSPAWDGWCPDARVGSAPRWAPGWPADCEKTNAVDQVK